MASVKLWKGEVGPGGLPDVCVRCGAPATTTVREKFRWCPQWVIVLILAGVLVWVIVALILTKTMAVDAPVCDDHRNHWRTRKLVGWLLVLGGLGAMVGGVVLMANAGGPGGNPDVAGFAFLVGAIVFLVTLIAAAVIMNSGIKPTEITDRTLTLKGVSDGFVDALEEDRARADEEEDRDRQERRRARDDR